MTPKDSCPQFWSLRLDSSGNTVLNYAIHSGKALWLLTLLGTLCIIGSGWSIYALLAEGEITIFGIIFILLIPGAILLFGAHCLATVFVNRVQYQLSPHQLKILEYSLLGPKTTVIAHSAVSSIEQYYFPPSSSTPAGSAGSWTTFVITNHGDRLENISLVGMRSKQEAKWLGALIAKWANKPISYSKEN